MDLQTFWFCAIAVLWAGYFVLEGFDFGVGMLLPILPRDERERRVLFESIGPFWDGNEVWLVVAAGATFAAFPEWYATMFSGFYLALLLVLVFLIIRVVSFEWRARGEGQRWRSFWLAANTAGSFGAPFLWGVALANLVHGVPLASNGDFAGSFGDLFSLYTVAVGLAIVLLFAFHGATFLTLRTSGELCDRAAAAARTLALPAAALTAGILVWTVAVAVDRNDKDVFPPLLPAAAGIAAVVFALILVMRRRSCWAFGMTTLAVAFAVATIFTSLYPRVLVSSPSFSNSLTIANAASTDYVLRVLTVVALVLLPVVLLYQGWTYYVFRRRLGSDSASPEAVEATHGAPGTPATRR
jgi:cytochrome bd ubiquinol oxidase subunit II